METTGHVLVCKANTFDIEAIQRIARQHAQAVGFVMRPMLQESIERGTLWLAWDFYRGRIVGFINYRPRRDGVNVVKEIAVDRMRLREGIGAQLLGVVPCPVRLKCTEDNPANAFYANQGFALMGTEDGRKRRLNVWSKSG